MGWAVTSINQAVPARFAPHDQVPRLPGRAAGVQQHRQRFLDLAKVRWAVLILLVR